MKPLAKSNNVNLSLIIFVNVCVGNLMPYFILYDISIKNTKSDILIADRELYVSKIYVKYGIIHSSFSDFYHSRYYELITIFKRYSRHSRTKTTTATQTSKLMFNEVGSLD